MMNRVMKNIELIESKYGSFVKANTGRFIAHPISYQHNGNIAHIIGSIARLSNAVPFDMMKTNFLNQEKRRRFFLEVPWAAHENQVTDKELSTFVAQLEIQSLPEVKRHSSSSESLHAPSTGVSSWVSYYENRRLDQARLEGDRRIVSHFSETGTSQVRDVLSRAFPELYRDFPNIIQSVYRNCVLAFSNTDVEIGLSDIGVTTTDVATAQIGMYSGSSGGGGGTMNNGRNETLQRQMTQDEFVYVMMLIEHVHKSQRPGNATDIVAQRQAILVTLQELYNPRIIYFVKSMRDSFGETWSDQVKTRGRIDDNILRVFRDTMLHLSAHVGWLGDQYLTKAWNNIDKLKEFNALVTTKEKMDSKRRSGLTGNEEKSSQQSRIQLAYGRVITALGEMRNNPAFKERNATMTSRVGEPETTTADVLQMLSASLAGELKMEFKTDLLEAEWKRKNPGRDPRTDGDAEMEMWQFLRDERDHFATRVPGPVGAVLLHVLGLVLRLGGHELPADVYLSFFDTIPFTPEILQFAEDYDMPKLIGLIGVRPNQTYDMGSAYATRKDKCGFTFIGDHNFGMQSDVVHKLLKGSFQMYAAPAITSPVHLVHARDIFCRGYIGGNSTEMWNPNDPLDRKMGKSGSRTKDIYMIAVPINEISKCHRKVFDLTGYYEPTVGGEYDVKSDPCMYSTAPIYREIWDWVHHPDSAFTERKYSDVSVHKQTMVWQDEMYQYVPTGSLSHGPSSSSSSSSSSSALRFGAVGSFGTFQRTIKNQGLWGTTFEGCAAMRVGMGGYIPAEIPGARSVNYGL